MTSYPATVQSFTELAMLTGGHCEPADDAAKVVERIREMLAGEFRDLRFDAGVLEIVSRIGTPDLDAIAGSLGCSRLQAASSVGRLGRRGFLSGPQPDERASAPPAPG